MSKDIGVFLERELCQKCGLYKKCISPRIEMERGSLERPRVLILGEASGAVEDTLGKPFIGDSGKLLREALAIALPENKRVWITNAVKCRPENNKLKGVTPIKCCYEFTLEDIKEADPDIIICCGATAYRQIGGSGAITSVRGRIFDIEILGRVRKVAPVFHPAYILRNIGSMSVWEEDLKRIGQYVSSFSDKKYPQFTMVSKEEFVSIAKEVGWFSFDIETNRELDFTNSGGFITTMSFCSIKEGTNYCYAIELPEIDSEEVYFLRDNLFSDTKLTIVGHNIKFDFSWVLKKLGFIPSNEVFDTQTAYSVLVNEESNNSLKTLAYIYTEFGGYEQEMNSLDKDIPLGYSKTYYNEILTRDYKDTLLKYNIYDTIVTAMIYLKLKELAEETPELYKILYGIFFKMSKLVSTMEYNGVKFDTWLLDTYSKEIDERLKEYTLKFKKAVIDCGLPATYASSLNPKSAIQIRELIYDKLKFPVIITTENNAPSVNEQAIIGLLNSLKEDNSPKYFVIRYLISIRALHTINNLFITKFKEGLRGEFVHPRYSIVKIDRSDSNGLEAGGTVTSRLSSANPNLQQIPNSFPSGIDSFGNIKAEALRDINLQNLVCSRFKDGKILLADFSQIELRVATILSRDEGMLHAYNTGVDLHKLTASQVFEVPFDEVTSVQRQQAKAVNFGIIYGQSAVAFASLWGVSKEDAQKFINKYFEVRKGLKKFIDSTRKEVIEKGYVFDLFGKVRRLGNAWSEDKAVVEEAVRQAVNFKCQSSASIMTFISLLRIFEKFNKLGMKSLIIGTVHDSIIIDCSPDEIEDVKKVVESSMTNWSKFNFPIPIKVDISLADRWGSAKK